MTESNTERNAGRTEDSLLRACFYVAIFGATYVGLSLSKRPEVFPIALGVFCVLEVARLITKVKNETAVEVGCEISFFVVLSSIFVGTYLRKFEVGHLFFFSTIIYRPYFTLHHNKRLALMICSIIPLAVLPVSMGIVKTTSIVEALTIAFAMLVATLWIACSRIASILTE